MLGFEPCWFFYEGLVMVAVIVGSRKMGVNPDNVATPIAASLGDLITLSLLAAISSFLFHHRGQGSRSLIKPHGSLLLSSTGVKISLKTLKSP